MNHNKYIKGIMPILIREFQRKDSDKEALLIEAAEYFNRATPEIVTDSMNMVRNLRRDDGSDGHEKYYYFRRSRMTKEFRKKAEEHLAGLDSKLLLFWNFLDNKLEKMGLKTASDSERSFSLDEVVDPRIKRSMKTRTRNDLYGYILGLTSSDVPELLNLKTNKEKKHKSEVYLKGLNLKQSPII